MQKRTVIEKKIAVRLIFRENAATETRSRLIQYQIFFRCTTSLEKSPRR